MVFSSSRSLRAAAFILSSACVSAPAFAGVPVPIDSSYKLTFDDEFNGTALDTTKWNAGWYANAAGISQPINSIESCAYSNANISFSSGNLVLAATNTGASVNGKSYPCTGASVDTFGKFSQAYGYVEARIYLDGTADGTIYNWPAFWLTGNNWPKTGELDVLEGLGGDAEYHFHDPQGGPGGAATGNYVGWHVFAALWVPGSVTYYYDGKAVGQIAQGITSAVQSLVITQAVGGYGGPTVIPAQMRIDYVHMYSNAASAKAITPQAGYGGPGDNGGIAAGAGSGSVASGGSSSSSGSGSGSAAANLMANPGFESGLASYSSFGSVSLSSAAHGGSKAVQFAGADAGIQQTVSGLLPNTKYLFSGYLMVTGGKPVLGVKGFGGAQVSQGASSSGSYQLVSVPFTTGKKATSAVVFCYAAAKASKGSCDDLSVSVAK